MGRCHRSGVANGSPVSENHGAGDDEDDDGEGQEGEEASAAAHDVDVFASSASPLLLAALGFTSASGEITFLKASRARSAMEGR